MPWLLLLVIWVAACADCMRYMRSSGSLLPPKKGRKGCLGRVLGQTIDARSGVPLVLRLAGVRGGFEEKLRFVDGL